MTLLDPTVWEDGEDPENIPTADDLNTDWRDTFNFLLGINRPMIIAHSTAGQALTGTPVAITWDIEVLKRGGMVHSASSANIQVPYTGEYQGYMMGGFGTFSTTTTRAFVSLKNGSTIVASGNHPAVIIGGTEFVVSFTTYATAGDIYTMTQAVTAATTCTASTNALNRPRIAMWYAGGD